MSQHKSQSINCTVDTCEYHDQGDMCRLASIHVSPIISDVESCEDSMCQSFMRKDQ